MTTVLSYVSSLQSTFVNAIGSIGEYIYTDGMGLQHVAVTGPDFGVAIRPDSPTIPNGYYLAKAGDTLASIASQHNINAQILQRINQPFSDSALNPPSALSIGGWIHVPITQGASNRPLSGPYTYVVDPASATVYTVGAAIDGSDSGALIVDVPKSNGAFIRFAAGAYSSFNLQAMAT